VPGKEEISAK